MKFKRFFALIFSVVFLLNSLNITYATETTASDKETTTTSDETKTEGTEQEADATTETAPTEYVSTTEQVVEGINAESYVLMDQDTGRILVAYNEHEKRYPASLTKLLTALVAVDYIEPDELILTGYEVNEVPWDSSIAGLKPNEYITFENLLRALLIPSGNDAGNVIAMEVARRVSGNENISYDDAIELFAGLMNDKAKEVGAVNSNFVTPHGYHDENHYTTAYDMAMISRAAFENTLIKEICSEKYFNGYGAGDQRTVDMFTQEYTWDNTNLLLGGRLSSSDYTYKYATGGKTGSTSEAGHCLVATATNGDDENLLSVVMKDDDPDTWYDTKKLFEYGFDNYDYVTLNEKNSMIKEVLINNPRLGESNILDLVTADDVKVLLNEEEVSEVKKTITINEEYKAKNRKGEDVATDTTLKTPISKGEAVGTVTYTLDGEPIYTGNLVAMNDVLKRTFKSDVVFYLKVLKEILCSWLIIPITTAVILMTVFGIRWYNVLKKKKERIQRSRKYKFRKKP